jgi:hypothetical protein
VDGGMLWRNGCDGKVLRCGAGNRHQQDLPPRGAGVIFRSGFVLVEPYRPGTVTGILIE